MSQRSGWIHLTKEELAKARGLDLRGSADVDEHKDSLKSMTDIRDMDTSERHKYYSTKGAWERAVLDVTDMKLRGIERLTPVARRLRVEWAHDDAERHAANRLNTIHRHIDYDGDKRGRSKKSRRNEDEDDDAELE